MKKLKDLKTVRQSRDGIKLRSINIFVPETLHERLRKEAFKNFRSVGAEARRYIELGFGAEKNERS